MLSAIPPGFRLRSLKRSRPKQILPLAASATKFTCGNLPTVVPDANKPQTRQSNRGCKSAAWSTTSNSEEGLLVALLHCPKIRFHFVSGDFSIARRENCADWYGGQNPDLHSTRMQLDGRAHRNSCAGLIIGRAQGDRHEAEVNSSLSRWRFCLPFSGVCGGSPSGS